MNDVTNVTDMIWE